MLTGHHQLGQFLNAFLRSRGYSLFTVLFYLIKLPNPNISVSVGYSTLLQVVNFNIKAY